MIIEKRITDFEKLGFGMFVHFGLYSVLGKGEWALHSLNFANKKFSIVIHGGKEYGEYVVTDADCDGVALNIHSGKTVMEKNDVDALDEYLHTITINLN